MVADGRKRHAERLGELADGARAAQQLLDDAAACRIGERLECEIERDHLEELSMKVGILKH